MQTQSGADATIRSPHPAAETADATLPELVLARAQELGDKPALIDAPSGRTLTYGELAAGVERVAAGLAARGFGRGDVLAMFAPNLPEWPLPLLGALAAGGTVTTANPLYTAGELATQLADARPRVLVTVPPFDAVAREAAAQVGVEEVVELPALMRAAGPPPVPDTDLDEVALLLYSSGTTGLPKGVALTHRQVAANLAQMAARVPAREDDVVLAVAPFFHTLGLTALLCRSLAAGATVVTLARFDFEAFLAALQDHRVTQTIVVPPILLGLAQHPAVESYDLSALRWLGCGAAPASPELELAVAERIGCVVGQGYGMTEATACIAILDVEHPETIVPGSVGTLLPGTEGRIVDAAGEPAEEGELWIRGPQVMSGYLGRPDETAAMLDADGWLHTGDLVRADDAGNLFIVDRLKELIKYKGFQVAPAELEALLITHPRVQDAAVVRGHDAQAGEIPVAYVVAAGELDGDELMAWVAERVAPHKRVRRVELIDAIPKSPSGKILRRTLVERERVTRPG
jgi:acyl-CoA synthetase (AMP-forming)/AMP-acid ligase II